MDFDLLLGADLDAARFQDVEHLDRFADALAVKVVDGLKIEPRKKLINFNINFNQNCNKKNEMLEDEI